MSALPPKADIDAYDWNVRYGPIADIRYVSASARDALQNAKGLDRAISFAFLKILLCHCHRVRDTRKAYNFSVVCAGERLKGSNFHFNGEYAFGASGGDCFLGIVERIIRSPT
jgi:hypothetical protein